MQPSATDPLRRSSAFGTRTSFKRLGGSVVTKGLLSLLRALKPEHDARSIGSLHFAYWAVLPRRRLAKILAASGRKPNARIDDQLLFCSDFSGDWEVYLAGFNVALLIVLDLVWGNARGWKNDMKLAEYLAYIHEHELHAAAYFQAYGDRATVYDVRSALALSEALDRFVAEAGTDEHDFERAYSALVTEAGAWL